MATSKYQEQCHIRHLLVSARLLCKGYLIPLGGLTVCSVVVRVIMECRIGLGDTCNLLGFKQITRHGDPYNGALKGTVQNAQRRGRSKLIRGKRTGQNT